MNDIESNPKHATETVVQIRMDSLSSSTVTAIVDEYLLRTKNIECNAAVLNGKSKKVNYTYYNWKLPWLMGHESYEFG